MDFLKRNGNFCNESSATRYFRKHQHKVNHEDKSKYSYAKKCHPPSNMQAYDSTNR